ncbi:MAG: BREX-4 system phosphatase PglZ, partial [Promethearchaeota archaeon]
DVFNSILISLFEIENLQKNPEKRIYIPMLGLWERFQKEFLENFHRKNEWATIWKIDEQVEQQIKIYQVNFSLKTGRSILKTTSDWFELWKHDKIKSLISSSRSLGYLYKDFLPDAIYEMEELTDHKSYIKSIIGIDIPIKYSKKETEFWIQLTEELESRLTNNELITFEYYIRECFNIKNIINLSNLKLLKLYLDTPDKYKRWLLKAWILSNKKYEMSYLYYVLLDSKNYTDDELIYSIWFKIFSDDEYKSDHFRERKEMIEFIHIKSSISYSLIESDISDFLNGIENISFSKQSDYLTKITIAERIHIINQFIKQDDLLENMPILKEIYPEIYYYLSWDMPLDELQESSWITDYFREYCLSKLLNKPTDKLIEILNKKNLDSNTFYSWYYKFQSYPEFKDAKVIWIDGLGAEWTSLLLYIINKHIKDTNKIITKKSIVKVNLPSITDCNRYSDSFQILNLDNYIHKEKPYQHPRSLIEQIELIESIVKDKILKYSENKIVIIADHGFTFLAQKKYGNFKKFDYENADHEGRCLWVDRKFKSDTNFLYHIVDKGLHKNKKVLIALKYTSLQNIPFREVHGGATPEEILVPYIEISKTHKELEHSISLKSNEISTSSPKLNIIIEPEPRVNPILTIKEKQYTLKKEKRYWCIEMKGFLPKEYFAILNVGNKNYPISFIIKGGLEEEELF